VPVPAAKVELMKLDDAEPKRAREHFLRGAQAFDKGDFVAALGAFAEASRLSKAPGLLYDTALCYHQLKHFGESQQLMQLYLDRAPGAANRVAVERLIREDEAAEDAD
jgi:hypothetical protein